MIQKNNLLDQKQMELAFQGWLRHCGLYPVKFPDPAIRRLCDKPALNASLSLLKLARQAQLYSPQSVAQKLNVSRQAYLLLEESEIQGNISLKSLQQAVTALDCEIILEIRHSSQIPFSRLIWSQIYPEALKHHWVQSRPAADKARALAAIARNLFRNPKWRRQQGWIRNSTED